MDIDVIQMITIKYIAWTHGIFGVLCGFFFHVCLVFQKSCTLNVQCMYIGVCVQLLDIA